MPMYFEVYETKSKKFSWRLKAGNHQIVAGAGETFPSAANAKRSASAFKKGAEKQTFEVYADKSGAFRWRAKARNGENTASSGEPFSNKSNAQRAARNVQSNAGAAEGP